VRLLTTVLLATLACGSAFAQEDIEAIDRTSGIIPSLRLSVDIAGQPAGPLGPAVPHSGHGFELGLTGGSGEDTQSFSGAPVVFGGRIFLPGTLQHEFDFGFLEVAYRFRHFFGASRVFGIEAIGGIGIASLDLTTTSGTTRASQKIENGGLVAGFGIVWKFLPATSLQSRITVFGSGEREGVTGAARVDVHVAHAVARNVALRAGLVSWGIVSQRAGEDDDNDSLNSRIRAGLSGLSLGLDIAF
jgi:hypothetical protein